MCCRCLGAAERQDKLSFKALLPLWLRDVSLLNGLWPVAGMIMEVLHLDNTGYLLCSRCLRLISFTSPSVYSYKAVFHLCLSMIGSFLSPLLVPGIVLSLPSLFRASHNFFFLQSIPFSLSFLLAPSSYLVAVYIFRYFQPRSFLCVPLSDVFDGFFSCFTFWCFWSSGLACLIFAA